MQKNFMKEFDGIQIKLEQSLLITCNRRYLSSTDVGQHKGQRLVCFYEQMSQVILLSTIWQGILGADLSRQLWSLSFVLIMLKNRINKVVTQINMSDRVSCNKMMLLWMYAAYRPSSKTLLLLYSLPRWCFS